MNNEIWVLFFIIFIGIVWVTILYKLQQIEKLLAEKSKDRKKESDVPSYNS